LALLDLEPRPRRVFFLWSYSCWETDFVSRSSE
jgi:hypothetical protein